MEKEILKKNIILWVLKVLCKYSSKGSGVPQTAITKYLNDMGVLCDRKTVGRNIKYLQDFGVLVEKDEKGYYVDRIQVLEHFFK